MKKLTRGQVALITIVLVLIVDQAVKIWVKTHMYIGESIRVTDWFYIAFIENNGMAFGMEVGSKLFLSLFRIVAVVFLSWWMLKIKNRLLGFDYSGSCGKYCRLPVLWIDV